MELNYHQVNQMSFTRYHQLIGEYFDNYIEIKSNASLISFFKHKEHFSAICDMLLCNNQGIISSKHLTDMPTNQSHNTSGENPISIDRNRDLMKLFDNGEFAIMIGFEIQQSLDYNMVNHIMDYDADYYMERSKLGEKPIMIITITIYVGEQNWTCKDSLKEYYDYPHELDSLINDWKNLVFVLKDIDKKTCDEKVNTLIEAVQLIYRFKRKDLKALENLKKLNIDRETGLVIGAITKFRPIIENALSTGEEFNMCGSLERAMNECKIEGKTDTLIRQLTKKLRVLSSRTIEVINNCSLEQLDKLTDSIFDVTEEADIYKLLNS